MEQLPQPTRIHIKAIDFNFTLRSNIFFSLHQLFVVRNSFQLKINNFISFFSADKIPELDL